MSAISVGLAATITEWFGSSHGDGGTAVQTAAPVNVEAARAKAKKKATRRKAKPVKPVDPKPAESVVVAEPPKPAPDAGPPPSASRGTGVIESPRTRVPPESPTSAPPAGADGDGETPASVPNEPTRPDKIVPIGRKLEEPKKTAVAGPKVIRVEQPESLPSPRPRAPRAGGPEGPRGRRGRSQSGAGRRPTSDRAAPPWRRGTP